MKASLSCCTKFLMELDSVDMRIGNFDRTGTRCILISRAISECHSLNINYCCMAFFAQMMSRGYCSSRVRNVVSTDVLPRQTNSWTLIEEGRGAGQTISKRCKRCNIYHNHSYYYTYSYEDDKIQFHLSNCLSSDLLLRLKVNHPFPKHLKKWRISSTALHPFFDTWTSN